MRELLTVEKFLEKARLLPMIDVRSPSEYRHAHIPEALSLPLFSDEERAVVGTLYKRNGRVKAVQQGLEFVGPKLKEFSKFALKTESPELLVHCWRGGMRSSAMAWLFETLDIKVNLLEGGYKSYRNHVLEQFKQPYRLILIGGYTGSGKTRILQYLKESGEQVIDLESLANHKGSAFGSLGQMEQPSSEYFENLLHRELSVMDATKAIWLEDESRCVGKAVIPHDFWNRMDISPLIKVNAPYQERLERIMAEYSLFSKDDLTAAIKRIEKRLGFDNCKNAITACERGDIEEAAVICLAYYDKAYQNLLDKRQRHNRLPEIETGNLTKTEIVRDLIKLSETVKASSL